MRIAEQLYTSEDQNHYATKLIECSLTGFVWRKECSKNSVSGIIIIGYVTDYFYKLLDLFVILVILENI